MGSKHEKKPLDILRDEKEKIRIYINRHEGHSDFLAGYIELLKEYENAIDVLCEWQNIKQREGALPIFDVRAMLPTQKQFKETIKERTKPFKGELMIGMHNGMLNAFDYLKQYSNRLMFKGNLP